jgi:hypothetical protein
MGFIMFALTLAAIALMSTTKESRAEALASNRFDGFKRVANIAGVFSVILLASFCF